MCDVVPVFSSIVISAPFCGYETSATLNLIGLAIVRALRLQGADSSAQPSLSAGCVFIFPFTLQTPLTRAGKARRLSASR